MRKYNRPSFAANANNTVSRCDLHWEAFSAYVTSHVERFPDFADLAAAIAARDVPLVLSLSESVSLPSRLYKEDVSVSEALIRRQVGVFLKKFPFSEAEFAHDRLATATTKWFRAEEQCAATNRKLGWRGDALLPPWFLRAKAIIADVLGDLEPDLLMKILSQGTHGPGATTASKGNRTTPYYKYVDLPYTCTSRALSYAYAAISMDAQWMEILEASGRRKSIPPSGCPLYQQQVMLLNECVEIVDPDTITFVPKDAFTDRPIAVGSSLNMYMQLGVGDYIARRLQKFGVDLFDQSRNQELACAGSTFAWHHDGSPNLSSFATIDLASASDTISLELVRKLLPPSWFAFLDDIRHHVGSHKGELHCYAKFSAMGCGFTFPLESLIFWAVAKAAHLEEGLQCKREDIAVYGDDIIVRAKAAPCVINALEWAGFSVNTEKSFITGSFKESCGADFYRGTDVRPFYLKRRIESYVDIYFICNSISHRYIDGKYDSGLVAVFCTLLKHIPRSHRLFRPVEDDKECGLQVPIQYMRQLGLAPWLSHSELRVLRTAKLVSDSSGLTDTCEALQSPYAWRILRKPLIYKGRGSVRYYLRLLSLSGKFDAQLDMARFSKRDLRDRMEHLIATSAGNVTRRKSFTVSVNVAPVLNWNDGYTYQELSRHPIWMEQ